MATCLVSGTLLDPSGTALTSVTVFARIPNSVLSGTSLITPYQLTVQTDSSGNFAMTLQQSISVIFTIQYPSIGTDPKRNAYYTGNIPATTTASFSSVIVSEV